jgi:hypothetical protein
MTGAEIYENFQQQISQYTTDYANVTLSNYILNKALQEQIEDNYNNFAVQEIKDEIAGLIKTNVSKIPVSNAISLGYNPIQTITAASSTTYTVVFTYPITMGSGITATLADILGVSNANGTYTYSTTIGLGLYVIVNTTTITIGVSAASGTQTNQGYGYSSNSIANYLHILAVKAIYEQETSYTVTNASNASPIVVTTTRYNNLREKEKIKISGVSGNTNTNGTHYIKPLKQVTFALYSDEKLKTPISGNGGFSTSSGTITRIVETYCKVLESDRKKTVSTPNINNPEFEISTKRALIYPLNETCSEVLVDYLSTSPIEIDVEDTTANIEEYFNLTFVQKVINRAARIFKGIVDAPEEYQLQSQEISNNATT